MTGKVAERFETEVVGHMRALFRYGLRLAGNTTDADDMMQETLRLALDKRSEFREGTDIRAWLFSIQFNVHRHMLAKKVRRAVRETSNDAAMEAYPQLPTQYDRMVFLEAGEMIETLPRDQKSALYLVVFDGLSYSEAAGVLDCSEGTVKSRVARARATLCEMLNEHEPAPEPAMRMKAF